LDVYYNEDARKRKSFYMDKRKQLFTKSDIERFGFKYEPDPSKCKTRKLRFMVCETEEDKSEIAKDILWKYVHSVFIDTYQPFTLPTHYDHRVMIMGHGQIDVL